MLTLLTFIIDVYTDNKRWGKINHLRGAILRVPSFIIDIIIWPPNALLIAAYWGMFDIAINKVRKLPLDYVGETAWLDKMQRRYSVIWLLKVVVMWGGVCLWGILLNQNPSCEG